MQMNLPAISGLADLSNARVVLYQSGQFVHGPYGTGLVSYLPQTLTPAQQAQAQANLGITAPDGWSIQPLGIPIPVMAHLFDTLADALPPTDQAYRYILLTQAANAAGYNGSVLINESVTGSAPLVLATAEIDLAASPFHGKTVSLINSENRYLGAGEAAGTLLNDQMQAITGTFTFAANRRGTNAYTGAFGSQTPNVNAVSPDAGGASGAGTVTFDSASSPNARAGDHTRPRTLQLTYIMRVL